MPSRRPFSFYATGPDLAPVLARVEAGADIHYVDLTDRLSPDLSVHRSVTEIPDFLTSPTGVLNRQFYILPSGVIPQPKVAPHMDGRPRYSLTPQQVPEAIVLDEHGLCPGKGLLPSRIYLVGDNADLMRIYRAILKAVRSDFEPVRGWWLGPQAFEMLTAGERLTAFLAAPRANDLTPDR
ncbi:hypothetical protein [Pseudooceanicola onchidii]|uniref:hypothetical protein n=1 Tax=Pseudooceanicola onchidii TaxID=2562279 RepID=UPI0010A9D103|nr:hypothetical protein [Pseudooceanicola onchidii]